MICLQAHSAHVCNANRHARRSEAPRKQNRIESAAPATPPVGDLARGLGIGPLYPSTCVTSLLASSNARIGGLASSFYGLIG